MEMTERAPGCIPAGVRIEMLLYKMIRNRMTIILICLTVVQLILLITINFLSSENSQLKRTIEIMALEAKFNNGTATSSEPVATSSNENKNPRRFVPSEVTILLLKRQTSAFETKFEKVKRVLPSSHIKWDDKPGNMGMSLNRMIAEVQTAYFMVLEADVSLSDKTNEGIATLWDALERYPDIDFIGGSYLSGDKLHVACQRYKFCKWTYSESFEYKRSLENVMICDGTSASFMGRTKSMAKVQGGFDANISDILVVKDFFVRAKAANVIVATRPSFILLVHGFKSLYEKWQSHDITKDLVSFAVKYKVFIFKDEEGNVVDLCNPTSPLSGKDVCIESNAHRLMLNNGHWAYQGLYTYPFLLGYLKVSLREVTSFFEKHNVSYVLKGGVSLGAVKMHSILPWDAGDVDIIVYGMSVAQLLNFLRPWTTEMGYVLQEHRETEAVHVFCTPTAIGTVSGGLASIFPTRDPPPQYIRIKTNGIWVRYPRNLFQVIMNYYGQGYLEHKMYRKNEAIHCKIKGHNACLPNFKSLFNGKGGTYQEYFCEF